MSAEEVAEKLGQTSISQEEGQKEQEDGKMSVKQALSIVRQRIHFAIQRRGLQPMGEKVRLVAVSKFKPIEMIIEAYEAGQRHFGENYVEELLEKSVSEPIVQNCPEIKWHFIGHLQSNKVNKLLAVKNLFLVETVDSSKLADAINKRYEGRDGKLKVYVQVNTSREPNKSGVTPEDASTLAEHIITHCHNLELSGLMTIGSFDHSVEKDGDNPDFLILKDAHSIICKKFQILPAALDLSMGMSHDFEHAIELGATNVRVGSLIFGERNKK